MQAKTERFEMRLDQRTLERVDAWRSSQDDLPSRAEAVRRLMETGLAHSLSSSDGVELSDGEKLNLLMLCELYKHLGIQGGVEPAFLESVIYGGHYWGLAWKYPGIFHNHVDKKNVVTEVVDALDMWWFVESAYNKFTQAEKDLIAKEAKPFGQHVIFDGYDGNGEAEYASIAHFFIDDLERFSGFKGRSLNSHLPSAARYKRMLRVFEPMRLTIVGGELTPTQVIQLLKA